MSSLPSANEFSLGAVVVPSKTTDGSGQRANNSDLIKARLDKIESQNPRVQNHINRRVALGVEESVCTHFIKRKQRQCTHRAAPCSDKCTQHSDAAMEESRIRDLEARARSKLRTNAGGQEVPESNNKKQRVSAPKRMANPFSSDLTPDISDITSNWTDIYSNQLLPVHIDVGCAKGRCIQRLSRRAPRLGWNHLGVEIRRSLVDYVHGLEASAPLPPSTQRSVADVVAVPPPAVVSTGTASLTVNGSDSHCGDTCSITTLLASDAGSEKTDAVAVASAAPASASSSSCAPSPPSNFYVMTCNFAVSAEQLLQSLPAGAVRLVSIQFPDPWRKSKHEKRLIVQPALVDTLSRHLNPGACVYISSDCEDVAMKMNECFLNQKRCSYLGASNTEGKAIAAMAPPAEIGEKDCMVPTRCFDVLSVADVKKVATTGERPDAASASSSSSGDSGTTPLVSEVTSGALFCADAAHGSGDGKISISTANIKDLGGALQTLSEEGDENWLKFNPLVRDIL